MEVQEESAALTLTTPSDKHFMALTEQRWTDLKAWMDHAGTENGFQKDKVVTKLQLQELEKYLCMGARSLTCNAENQQVLGSLLASEIWLKEGNLDFSFWTTFDLFSLLFENKIEEETYRWRLIAKARNLQRAATSTGLKRNEDCSDLTLDFIRDLHRAVVEDLGISSELRTVHLAPSGMDKMYTAPEKLRLI